MDIIRQFHWRPEFGDATPLGWLATAAYALSAVIAFMAARRAGRAPGLPAGSRFIWMLVMALMVFLGLNKQLDLQSLLNETGRILCYNTGLYEQRREFQKWFVIGLAAAASLGALATFVFCGAFWKQHLLLLAGLIAVSAYVALRAISINHLDFLLGLHLSSPRTGGLLETGGIVLILLAAFIDWRNPRKAAKPPWKPASDPQR